MKIITKLPIMLLIMFAIITQSSLTAFAETPNNREDVTGPSIEIANPNYQDEQTFDLHQNADGSYSGAKSINGITAVSCFLSGNTGGIDDLYQIFIRWSGSSQVLGIRASNIKISSLNYSTTYYENNFKVDCRLTSSGTRAIGSCYIPSSVKTVRIKTTGLQTEFAYEYVWVSTGEINGTYQVN